MRAAETDIGPLGTAEFKRRISDILEVVVKHFNSLTLSPPVPEASRLQGPWLATLLHELRLLAAAVYTAVDSLEQSLPNQPEEILSGLYDILNSNLHQYRDLAYLRHHNYPGSHNRPLTPVHDAITERRVPPGPNPFSPVHGSSPTASPTSATVTMTSSVAPPASITQLHAGDGEGGGLDTMTMSSHLLAEWLPPQSSEALVSTSSLMGFRPPAPTAPLPTRPSLAASGSSGISPVPVSKDGLSFDSRPPYPPSYPPPPTPHSSLTPTHSPYGDPYQVQMHQHQSRHMDDYRPPSYGTPSQIRNMQHISSEDSTHPHSQAPKRNRDSYHGSHGVEFISASRQAPGYTSSLPLEGPQRRQDKPRKKSHLRTSFADDPPSTASFHSTRDPIPPVSFPTQARESLYTYLASRDRILQAYPPLRTLQELLAAKPTELGITNEICADQQTVGGCPHIANAFHGHPSPHGQTGRVRYYHYQMQALPHRHSDSAEVERTGADTGLAAHEELFEATHLSHVNARRVVDQHQRLRPCHFPTFHARDDTDRNMPDGATVPRHEDAMPPDDIFRIPLNLLAMPDVRSARDRHWRITFRSRILVPPQPPVASIRLPLHKIPAMRYDAALPTGWDFFIRAHPHAHHFSPILRQYLDTLFRFLNNGGVPTPDQSAEWLASFMLYRERNPNPLVARVLETAEQQNLSSAHITGMWPSPEASANTTADRETYPIGLQLIISKLTQACGVSGPLPPYMTLTSDDLHFHCMRILREDPITSLSTFSTPNLTRIDLAQPRRIPFDESDPRLTLLNKHVLNLDAEGVTGVYDEIRDRFYATMDAGLDYEDAFSIQSSLSLPPGFPQSANSFYGVNQRAIRTSSNVQRAQTEHRLIKLFRSDPSSHPLPPRPSADSNRFASAPLDNTMSADMDVHRDPPPSKTGGSDTTLWYHDDAFPRHGARSTTGPSNQPHFQQGDDDPDTRDSMSEVSEATILPLELTVTAEEITRNGGAEHLARSWSVPPPYNEITVAQRAQVSDMITRLYSLDPATYTEAQVSLLEGLVQTDPTTALTLVREQPFWCVSRLPTAGAQLQLAESMASSDDALPTHQLYRLASLALRPPDDPIVVRLKNSTASTLYHDICRDFDRAALGSRDRDTPALLQHFGWHAIIDRATGVASLRHASTYVAPTPTSAPQPSGISSSTVDSVTPSSTASVISTSPLDSTAATGSVSVTPSSHPQVPTQPPSPSNTSGPPTPSAAPSSSHVLHKA